MIFVVLLFFISIIIALGMLSFRAWELRSERATFVQNEYLTFEFSFRKLEIIVLHYAKHIIQSFVLIIVKYWFLGIAKTKKWLMEKWPKVHHIIHKKNPVPISTKPSFFTKALMESKIKISRIKQKIRDEHEM